MKKPLELPLRRSSRTEHVTFRVEPEVKQKLNLLKEEGVNVHECMHQITVEWLSEVEKQIPLKVGGHKA